MYCLIVQEPFNGRINILIGRFTFYGSLKTVISNEAYLDEEFVCEVIERLSSVDT